MVASFFMRTVTIIANPQAGRGKALKVAKRLAADLERDCRVVLSETASVADTDVSVSDALKEGHDALVVAGGDGTVRSVLNGLADSSVALGVLATGRGNDFVRCVGGMQGIVPLAAAIRQGETRRIDLGSANGRAFGTVASCGLDAEVGCRVAEGSALSGMAAYLLQAVKSLRTFSGYAVRVEADGRHVFEGEASLVACANTATYGGGFKVAPGADHTDGLLDLCLVERVGRLEALSLLPALVSGQHAGHPMVTVRHVREVRVSGPSNVPSLADGEVMETFPMEVAIRPKALRVLNP